MDTSQKQVEQLKGRIKSILMHQDTPAIANTPSQPFPYMKPTQVGDKHQALAAWCDAFGVPLKAWPLWLLSSISMLHKQALTTVDEDTG